MQSKLHLSRTLLASQISTLLSEPNPKSINYVKCFSPREFDRFLKAIMDTSFIWHYAKTCQGQFLSVFASTLVRRALAGHRVCQRLGPAVVESGRPFFIKARLFLTMRSFVDEFEGIFGSLTIAAHSYKKAINDELLHHGITMRQWQVLKCLRHEENVALCMLAERLRLKPPTLVGVLSRMKRKGLIATSLGSDRREKRIRLTSRGRELCAVGTACEQRVDLEVLSSLSDAEGAQLLTVLKKIRSNLESRANCS